MIENENKRETHLRVGRQTVKLALIKVIHDLFPDERLKTSYSIQEGIFCNLADSILSVREVKLIDLKLREYLDNKENIQYLGKKDGYYQYLLGDVTAKVVYPAYTSHSMVEPFQIIPFSYGFIVDFGDIDQRLDKPLIPPYKLSEAFEKHQLWLKNISIEQVSDINSYIRSGESIKSQYISEALHEKEISEIADMILHQRRVLRVLLIAGPSSSGKTSFAQRLSTQLQVNGLNPISMSLDDYFVNREDTPIDEEGNYDLDSFETLDLTLLQDHITRLIKGESIETPIFDFLTGSRSQDTKNMRLDDSEILIIEGIHALNPRLVSNINKSQIFKIYISVLGGLNIDLVNRLPTTEIRLIRRLVRDDRFRGISPEQTLNQWPSVRRGEYKNIFAYQEEANVMFNSSMLYEMNALRLYAEDTLSKIQEGSPFYSTKVRLLNLLSFFEPMDISNIPFNSLLREFIGGSIYF